MLYSLKNIKELGNLNELTSSQCQEYEVRLQDKLGEQKYRQNVKKIIKATN